MAQGIDHNRAMVNLCEKRGFVGVEILKPGRLKEPQFTGQISVDEVISLMTVKQDYAIIGYKT